MPILCDECETEAKLERMPTNALWEDWLWKDKRNKKRFLMVPVDGKLFVLCMPCFSRRVDEARDLLNIKVNG